MNINKLNVAQICHVQAFLKRPLKMYYFVPEKKSFFNNTKAGFRSIYDWKTDTIYSKEEIEKCGTVYVEGEKVFNKPYLKITMADGTEHNKWFEKPEEVKTFMETEEMKSVTWINN